MAKPKTKPPTKNVKLQDTEIGTSELAAIVGKTPQWIRQLTRDNVLKQVDGSRGKYVLAEAIQAYCEHVAGGKEEDEKPRFIDHKTEHERIKAEKAALELAEMRGELHRAEDVERALTDMILTVKTKLQAVPARVAPKLDQEPAAIIQKTLTTEINAALMSLVNYTPEMFAADNGGGADG